jgi:5-oxoprolinase (ATP-hydrolysing) subunit B
MRRHAVGPAAWLVDDVEDPAAWAASLRAHGVAGIVEIVPAEYTVLVVCERSRSESVGMVLDGVVIERQAPESAPTTTIDVMYDGDDLAAVAEATGLGIGEVIARHSAGEYKVAFCGFSPGFAYMTGLDPALQIPRRDSPRTSVPAGSVAIAAGYTSVYPSASPGGWHLLGTTTAVLWDASSPEPALLTPGSAVRFRQVSR